jgi:hypothetical protein
MKLTISTVLLTALLAVSAFAQRGFDVIIDPKGSPLTVTGLETSAGDPETFAPMVQGNTFMLSGVNGDINYSLSVAFDYSANPDEPQSYDVASGNWTLSFFRDGNLVGTMFGDIPAGTISETRDENDQLTERNIKAAFRTQGGTGEYEYVQAEDEATGTLMVRTPGEGPDTKGELLNVLKK